jgi:hypothetical protein
MTRRGGRVAGTEVAFHCWIDPESHSSTAATEARLAQSADPGDVENADQLIGLIDAEREQPIAPPEYGLAVCGVSAVRHQVRVPRLPDQVRDALDQGVDSVWVPEIVSPAPGLGFLHPD